ncbi:MAG: RNA pseudouridine synthase [Saprospiraceae bacterium]|nr:RNA pseudouridine synthase [Saprospiraceae bacterium]
MEAFKQEKSLPACFTFFQAATQEYALPARFTFPFHYEPHPLCVLAAHELQHYLDTQTEWTHPFWADDEGVHSAIGKMFGVLIVESEEKQLGYLAAFSGKLAGENHHRRFVPPVFDILTQDGFFRKEEAVLNQLNQQIEELEQSPDLIGCQNQLTLTIQLAKNQIDECKQKIKTEKATRKTQREMARQTLDTAAFIGLEEDLRKESIKQQYYLKDLITYWNGQISDAQAQLDQFLQIIENRRQTRKQKSAALQQQLFEQYQFLNQAGISKGLEVIFQATAQKQPPAGAGECAAPKLLQYAFLHKLKPIAMAEFWWGQSPKLEIRKHQQFYPACRGKCEPILKHMLEGIPLDDNPMLQAPSKDKVIHIIYEDEYLLVINKPFELLSVPGKNVKDSVQWRIQQQHQYNESPLIVHRLDMSTSGLMVMAKTKEAHKALQYQFLKRLIKKRYVALLDGIVQKQEGTIDLPLRVDLEDRPRQMVCYEYGKSARTHWEVIDYVNGKTRIHFFPVTGRTHQLRVHAAHQLGLGIPIMGDDIYGTKADRLYLHAEKLQFNHPIHQQNMEFEVAATF